jgi:hypothetical protein
VGITRRKKFEWGFLTKGLGTFQTNATPPNIRGSVHLYIRCLRGLPQDWGHQGRQNRLPAAKTYLERFFLDVHRNWIITHK